MGEYLRLLSESRLNLNYLFEVSKPFSEAVEAYIPFDARPLDENRDAPKPG